METKNQNRTWGRKQCLFGENRDNSTCHEDDKPDKKSGQANAGIYIHFLNASMARLLGVLTESTGHCVPGRWCTRIFLAREGMRNLPSFALG
ncbi:hypothetical protein TNCV_2411391 [Trichonephila clavipes]|nr:hypothetical protein TNCV_2411391 [Trichonephila clavipes]